MHRLRRVVGGCLAFGMVVCGLLLGATASVTAEESSASSTSSSSSTSYKGAYFSFQYDGNWTLTEGEGFAQLTGKGALKTCAVRIYAIGLRSAGGKYRDLEHAVDDGIFQVRDEFGGSAGKKSDYLFKDADGKEIKGRQFTGEMKTGKVWWLVIPHTEDGVVVAVNIIAPKNFEAGKAALEAILKTLRLTLPPK